MTAEPPRFFFVHVQKAAGTVFFRRLRAGGVPDSAIYPDESDGDVLTVMPQLSVAHLLERWALRRDEIRIVMGHFPLCTVELLDAPFTTLTVLREPVERTLSYLRHHQKLTPADRDKSFEEIYEDQFRFESLIHNHMVKMFGLTAGEMTNGMLTEVDFTPAHLEQAKHQLATVDVLGLQEDFEAFCRNLEQRFGWRLDEPRFANRTTAAEVSPALRERIVADNALDVELYEFARRLVDQRSAVGAKGSANLDC